MVALSTLRPSSNRLNMDFRYGRDDLDPVMKSPSVLRFQRGQKEMMEKAPKAIGGGGTDAEILAELRAGAAKPPLAVNTPVASAPIQNEFASQSDMNPLLKWPEKRNVIRPDGSSPQMLAAAPVSVAAAKGAMPIQPGDKDAGTAPIVQDRPAAAQIPAASKILRPAFDTQDRPMASKDRMSGNLDVGRFNPGTGLLRPSGGIVVTDEATMARSLQDMDNANFNQKQAMNATVPEGGLRMVRPDGQVVVSSGSGKDGSYGVSRLGSGDRRLSDVAYTLNGVPVSSAEAEERQKAIDGTGDVWGRRDRAVAEQRNQNEIANSNYLRTPVATRQRQDAIDDQARAADTARYVADRGVDAAEAGAQGKQGGADAYSRQMADQMEKMAKAAEAAGDSDQAKWIREQMGEFFKRGISQGTDKKGNPLPPREPTVDETDQFNQLITGLANPVQPEQVKQAAGDKVRAWSRLSPEQQAQVLADPNQSASLKASAQLMWNTAQKADERTYQGMMKHPAMGLVKQILGKE